jgi:hypothetical protein
MARNKNNVFDNVMVLGDTGPEAQIAKTGPHPQPDPFRHPNTPYNPLHTPHFLPPSAGQVVIPPVQGMVALLQAGQRYYFQSDQAVRDSQQNSMLMERNLSIWEPLQSRLLSVCQLPLSVVPPNQKDPAQMQVALELQQIIEEIPNLFKWKWALAQAIWYGRSAVQNLYEFDFSKGFKRLIVRDWIPIHGDSLVYKWDSPAVGLRVGVTAGSQPGVRNVYAEAADFSRVHPLSQSEREAHVIHTHLLLAGNYLDPYSAGNVKGTGIRNVVYWTWYLQNQIFAQLLEYIERQGTGFTVVTFTAGDPASYEQAQTIQQAQSFQNIIAWPRYEGQARDGQDSIYRIEPSMTCVENLMTLVDGYFNAEMRRYIVGQDATSKPVATGLGSEIASVQENTFMRLVKMDALNLEDTLTRELLWVIQRYTYPNIDFKCRVKINTEKADKKEYMSAVKDFIAIGGTVIETEAREVLGFTEPDAEDRVLGGKINDNKVLGEQLTSEEVQSPELRQEQAEAEEVLVKEDR